MSSRACTLMNSGLSRSLSFASDERKIALVLFRSRAIASVFARLIFTHLPTKKYSLSLAHSLIFAHFLTSANERNQIFKTRSLD